jgi:hypothetical protein
LAQLRPRLETTSKGLHVSVFSYQEFPTLRAWLSFALAEPDIVPSGIFDVGEALSIVDAAAQESQSAGLKSVEIGIVDLISLSEPSVLLKLSEIDAKLANRGLPTYSQIAARVSKKLRKILKHGSIKSETDMALLMAYRDAKIDREISQKIEEVIVAHGNT